MSENGLGVMRRGALSDIFGADERFGADACFALWLRDNIERIGELIGEDFLDDPLFSEFAGEDMTFGAYGDDGERWFSIACAGAPDMAALGAFMVNMAAYGARKAIWIAEEFSAEIVAVFDMLNRGSGGGAFYAIRAEALGIDDSALAPLFSVAASPATLSSRQGWANYVLEGA